MASRPKPPTTDDLRTRIARASLAGDRAAADRARRLLLAWLDTSASGGASAMALARAIRDGTAARQVGEALRAEALRNPPPALRDAACAAGCAFCCILDGPDGGTITADEARAVHAALSPLAGAPDGREWHPAACPALDPVTRTCRIYEARPAICRAFVSTDAEACRINAEGGAAEGAGVLGGHLDYLAVLALSRAALKGIAKVESYALRRVAEAAVEGRDAAQSLEAARHPPRTLDDTRSDAGRAAAAAARR